MNEKVQFQIPGVVWFVIIESITLMLMDYLPRVYPGMEWIVLVPPIGALVIKVAAMLLKPDPSTEEMAERVAGAGAVSTYVKKPTWARILLG